MKRFVYLLLVAALVAGLFAACGSNALPGDNTRNGIIGGDTTYDNDRYNMRRDRTTTNDYDRSRRVQDDNVTDGAGQRSGIGSGNDTGRNNTNNGTGNGNSMNGNGNGNSMNGTNNSRTSNKPTQNSGNSNRDGFGPNMNHQTDNSAA